MRTMGEASITQFKTKNLRTMEGVGKKWKQVLSAVPAFNF